MEKYLRMSDFVVGKVQLALNRNFDACVSYDCADPDMLARKTMDAMEHAINSHDELVGMSKDLLAALECAEGFVSEVSEKTGFGQVHTLKVIRSAIAKAKATS